ncbi:hypothetical protein YC2023_028658 [Brassica napus]
MQLGVGLHKAGSIVGCRIVYIWVSLVSFSSSWAERTTPQLQGVAFGGNSSGKYEPWPSLCPFLVWIESMLTN